MKLTGRSIAWLLPLLLTGCIFHKTRQPTVQALLPPPIAGLPRPELTPVELSAPAMTIPSLPLDDAEAVMPAQSPAPPKRRSRPAGNAPPPSVNTQQAAGEAAGVSAIGELSSGDASDFLRQTASSIAATERGLNNIGRPLGKQEQKTAAQIRKYLKQAREALNSGDVDGAHTLAAKASVLLSELTQ
ncbi:MAG: hypothetical protein ABR956_11225 [Terracidiphilus sp.]